MDISLLQKFNRGECSPKEIQIVKAWFAPGSDKKLVLDMLEDSWNSFEVGDEMEMKGQNPDIIYMKIQSKLKEQTPIKNETE